MYIGFKRGQKWVKVVKSGQQGFQLFKNCKTGQNKYFLVTVYNDVLLFRFLWLYDMCLFDLVKHDRRLNILTGPPYWTNSLTLTGVDKSTNKLLGKLEMSIYEHLDFVSSIIYLELNDEI